MMPSQARAWQLLSIFGVLVLGAAVVRLPHHLGLRRTFAPAPILEPSTLAKPTDVRGRVVDAFRRPVVGQVVRLYTRDRRSDRRLAATTTGPDGVFVFRGAAPSRDGPVLYVSCDRPGRARASAYVSPDRPLGVWLRLAPLSVLACAVRDHSGHPVWGASVRPTVIDRVPERTDSKRYNTIRTDRLGRMTLAGVSAGSRVLLAVRAEGFADRVVECVVPSAGSPALTVRLRPGSEITGRVSYEGTGRPAAGVRLVCVDTRPVSRRRGFPSRLWFVDPLPAVTDGTGRYRLKGLTAGQWSVRLADDWVKKDWTAAAAQVALTQGQIATGADLILTRGQMVAVRVTDVDLGAPIAKASVVCYYAPAPDPGAARAFAETGVDGVAQLRVPVGPAHVSLARYSGRGPDETKTITVASGLNTAVALKVPGAFASGTVTPLTGWSASR